MPSFIKMKYILQGLLWLYLSGFGFMALSLEPGFLDFDNLPDTNFTCVGKVIGGYYADLETNCQMFHVCTIGQLDEPMDIRFLCLNGTVFDQETRVCERIDEVDCTKSEQFYSLNLELYGNTQGGILEESPETDPPLIIKSTTSTTTSTTTTTTTTTPRPKFKTTKSPYYSTPKQHHSTPTGHQVSTHRFPVGNNSPDIRFNPEEINISLNPGAPPNLRTKPVSLSFLKSFSDNSRNNNKNSASAYKEDDSKEESIHLIPVHGEAIEKPPQHHIVTTHKPKTVVSYELTHTKNPSTEINYSFTYRPSESNTQAANQPNYHYQTSYRPNFSAGNRNHPVFGHSGGGSAYGSSTQKIYTENKRPTAKTIYLQPQQNHQQFKPSYQYSGSNNNERTEKPHRVQLPLPLLPTLPPLTFSSPAPFAISRHIETKRYTKEHQAPPRIIISASASVSDASGRRLNYSLGQIGPPQILETPPQSYDEYKDEDVGLDPFYHDVPKIKSRKKRQTNPALKPTDIIKNDQEAVNVLKFLFDWYQNQKQERRSTTITIPVSPEIITEINDELDQNLQIVVDDSTTSSLEDLKSLENRQNKLNISLDGANHDSLEQIRELDKRDNSSVSGKSRKVQEYEYEYVDDNYEPLTLNSSKIENENKTENLEKNPDKLPIIVIADERLKNLSNGTDDYYFYIDDNYESLVNAYNISQEMLNDSNIVLPENKNKHIESLERPLSIKEDTLKEQKDELTNLKTLKEVVLESKENPPNVDIHNVDVGSIEQPLTLKDRSSINKESDKISENEKSIEGSTKIPKAIEEHTVNVDDYVNDNYEPQIFIEHVPFDQYTEKVPEKDKKTQKETIHQNANEEIKDKSEKINNRGSKKFTLESFENYDGNNQGPLNSGEIEVVNNKRTKITNNQIEKRIDNLENKIKINDKVNFEEQQKENETNLDIPEEIHSDLLNQTTFKVTEEAKFEEPIEHHVPSHHPKEGNIEEVQDFHDNIKVLNHGKIITEIEAFDNSTLEDNSTDVFRTPNENLEKESFSQNVFLNDTILIVNETLNENPLNSSTTFEEHLTNYKINETSDELFSNINLENTITTTATPSSTAEFIEISYEPISSTSTTTAVPERKSRRRNRIRGRGNSNDIHQTQTPRKRKRPVHETTTESVTELQNTEILATTSTTTLRTVPTTSKVRGRIRGRSRFNQLQQLAEIDRKLSNVDTVTDSLVATTQTTPIIIVNLENEDVVTPSVTTEHAAQIKQVLREKNYGSQYGGQYQYYSLKDENDKLSRSSDNHDDLGNSYDNLEDADKNLRKENHESLKNLQNSTQYSHSNLKISQEDLKDIQNKIRNSYIKARDHHKTLEYSHENIDHLKDSHKNNLKDYTNLRQPHENLIQSQKSLKDFHSNSKIESSTSYEDLNNFYKNLTEFYENATQYENITELHDHLSLIHNHLKQINENVSDYNVPKLADRHDFEILNNTDTNDTLLVILKESDFHATTEINLSPSAYYTESSVKEEPIRNHFDNDDKTTAGITEGVWSTTTEKLNKHKEKLKKYIEEIESSTKSVVVASDKEISTVSTTTEESTETTPPEDFVTETIQTTSQNVPTQAEIIPEEKINENRTVLQESTESQIDSTTPLSTTEELTTETKPTYKRTFTRRTKPSKTKNGYRRKNGRHRFSSTDGSTTIKPDSTTLAEDLSTDAPLFRSANPTQENFVKHAILTTPLSSVRRKEKYYRRFYRFNCFGKEVNKFYSDPRDCRLFHYCTQGYNRNQLLDMKFVCDQSTYFDEEKLICTNEKPLRCL